MSKKTVRKSVRKYIPPLEVIRRAREEIAGGAFPIDVNSVKWDNIKSLGSLIEALVHKGFEREDVLEWIIYRLT